MMISPKELNSEVLGVSTSTHEFWRNTVYTTITSNIAWVKLLFVQFLCCNTRVMPLEIYICYLVYCYLREKCVETLSVLDQVSTHELQHLLTIPAPVGCHYASQPINYSSLSIVP